MGIITDDFLLKTDTAKKLYHGFAENMPIIDYHCHISPKEIYENRKFKSITEVWLGGDHYKWRIMRSNGVDENEITGDADDYTKFLRFAEALEKAIGNPMYHWCHLELKRYFGYDGILNRDTAKEVFDLCNKKLAEDGMSVRGLIEKSDVRLIGTTDDPTDDLYYHKKLKEDASFKTKVVPTFRPDKAVNIDKAGFTEYILKLSDICKKKIENAEDVVACLKERLDYFCLSGCRATDHGLDFISYTPYSKEEVNSIFKKVINNEKISSTEADKYKTYIMTELGKEIARHDIVMQLHYGALRNTNSVMFRRLGPDTGFDCISSENSGASLALFLNALNEQNALPKTVIYSLNPIDNAYIDTVLGCFQSSGYLSKIQHGSAWWFNDTKIGMESHLKTLSSLALLGNFIGMLTDSRSFLSYTRHEYFRRILCNYLGDLAKNGEYPDDLDLLGRTVKNICYFNAERYFKI